MALSLLATGRQHLHSDEGESLLLEAPDDRRDQTALHAVGLDGDERALLMTRRDKAAEQGDTQKDTDGTVALSDGNAAAATALCACRCAPLLFIALT